MEDRHDDDNDGFGAGSHDDPADGGLGPALDPSLVDSGSGEDDGSAARHASQLPSASAAHELADALDDGTGHGSLDDGSSSHTLPQAFWDALPLGDSMHDQGRQTSSSSHTPTMEDLHAVMSHVSDPHPYSHPDDSAHYDLFGHPQPDSAGAIQHGHAQDQSQLPEGQALQQQDQPPSQQQQTSQQPTPPLPLRHQPDQQDEQRQQPILSQPHLYVPAPMSGLDLLHNVLVPQPSRSPEASKPSRKETHKMVERKRREVIAKGINEISELLPEPEKNKSLILGKAVDYIRQLQKTAIADHEKWAMERTMMTQAMADLRAMLTDERSKRRELEQTLHGIGRSAGLSGYGDIVLDQSPPDDAGDAASPDAGKRGPDDEGTSDPDRPPKRSCLV